MFCRKTILHCHVPLHMQRKMVWPAKGSFAQPALEWTVASMFSGMSGQLIWSGKFPTAAFPSAYVRLFAGMCSLVSFQVTRLGVGFGTTFLRTMVNDSFAFGPGSSLSRFGNFSIFTSQRSKPIYVSFTVIGRKVVVVVSVSSPQVMDATEFSVTWLLFPA